MLPTIMRLFSQPSDHFSVTEGIEHLIHPRSYVVRGLVLLDGSPMTNRSKATGQTKTGSEAPYNDIIKASYIT